MTAKRFEGKVVVITGGSYGSRLASAQRWSIDLKERGIRVNVVSPGATETLLIRGYFDAAPVAEEEVIKGVPLGRLGQLEEVANAVLFLASSESSPVAGHELFVDGGVAAV